MYEVHWRDLCKLEILRSGADGAALTDFARKILEFHLNKIVLSFIFLVHHLFGIYFFKWHAHGPYFQHFFLHYKLTKKKSVFLI